PHKDEIRRNRLSTGEPDCFAVEALQNRAQMEADAVGFMEPLQVPAHLLAEDAFKRDLFDRSHIDLHAAVAERGRRLERDKTRADHYGFRTGLCFVRDRARIGYSTQSERLEMIETGELQPVRLTPRR